MYTKEDYEGFFKEADTDESGSLTFEEVQGILKKFGYNIPEEQMKLMFRIVDTSGDGQISLDEYLQAMQQQPANLHGTAPMRRVFLQFDKNEDGKIDRTELKAIFADLGRHLSDGELTRVMELCDDDKSGDLDYEEFLKHFFNL